jgi:mRNA interferase MazF
VLLVALSPSRGADSGKPGPAVVVQADRWFQAHPSVTL